MATGLEGLSFARKCRGHYWLMRSTIGMFVRLNSQLGFLNQVAYEGLSFALKCLRHYWFRGLHHSDGLEGCFHVVYEGLP